MKYKNFIKFINFIKKTDRTVIIQTHNYPDPDALAAAYGLKFLLNTFGVKSDLVSHGYNLRFILGKMIEYFSMEIKSVYQKNNIDNQIITVDGFPDNSNFFPIKGNSIAFIDHHVNHHTTNYLKSRFDFYQLNPELGASSTIIARYIYYIIGHMPDTVATALAIGIYTDTNGLQRNTTDTDLNVFVRLFRQCDKEFFSYIALSTFEKKDIIFIRQALANIEIKKYYAFTYINGDIDSNILGLLADFLLSINEITFIFVANIGEKAFFSLRSKNKKVSAYAWAEKNLCDVAYFGGHDDAVGGEFVSSIQQKSLAQLFKNF